MRSTTTFGLLLIVVVGGFVWFQNMETPSASSESSFSNESGVERGGSFFTIAEVAEHTSRESCWSSIDGGAYDLTSWIPNHPGGEQAILQLCGTDGSAAFNSQHGGQSRQLSLLAGFRIGELAQ